MSETALADPRSSASDADVVHTASVPPSYDRLSYDQLGILLKLHADGTPQTVIAQALGCTQSNISHALKRLGTDTATLAAHHLKSRSFKAARRVTRIAEKGKDEHALKAARLVLEGAGVISSNTQGLSGVQVNVVVGLPNTGTLDASTITLGVVDKALVK